MKIKISYLTSTLLIGIAMFLVLCPWSAQATAPRITPQMFGEEAKADIVGYQSAPMDASAKAEDALTLEIVKEAFSAAGKSPVVDVLPSGQLAKYALVNNDAAALIGGRGDLTEQETGQHRVITFYLKGEEPVSLIFNKASPHADELRHAFNEGLQKIIKSGKYLEILEKYHGKSQAPTDYEEQLRRYNRGLE
jgi:ABC-type amino acid transport substrate-binding protein